MEWQQRPNRETVWHSIQNNIIDNVTKSVKKVAFYLACCECCGQSLFTSETDIGVFNNIKQTLLCQHCLNDLPQFKQQTLQGDLLNWPAINQALPNIHFDRLVCFSPYIAPFTHWLIRFKYRGAFEFSTLFGYLLAEQWHRANQYYYGDSTPVTNNQFAVVAVPLHLKKWQVRGYNQAHLIAQQFAKMNQINYIEHAVGRCKETENQMGKSGRLRRKNLQNAFKLNDDIVNQWIGSMDLALPKHILLIDDVVTTGSTASEIAKLFKQQGIKTVTLLTVCLSLPKNSEIQ